MGFAIGLFPIDQPDYTLRFEADGHTVGVLNANGQLTGSTTTNDQTVTVKIGTDVAIPSITKDGEHDFYWAVVTESGIYPAFDFSQQNPTVEATQDLTLRACGKPTSVTLTFDANGGTVSGETSRTVEYGTRIMLPEASPNGWYTFGGWYTSSSGGTKVGDAGNLYTVTDSVTLYAHWEAVPTITVTFYNSAGSAQKSMTVPRGSPITLITTSKASTTTQTFSLKQWHTKSSTGRSVGRAGDSFTPDDSDYTNETLIRLYPEFEAKTRYYTVEFFAYNYVSRKWSYSGKATVEYNTNINAAEYAKCDLDTRYYDAFWSRSETSKTGAASLGGTICVTENMKLYEQYVAKSTHLTQFRLTSTSDVSGSYNITPAGVLKGRFTWHYEADPNTTGSTLALYITKLYSQIGNTVDKFEKTGARTVSNWTNGQPSHIVDPETPWPSRQTVKNGTAKCWWTCRKSTQTSEGINILVDVWFDSAVP